MNYQWYPGHMKKARRMMEENIKLIDLIIELVDARIPLSSRNPEIDGLGQNKARLIVLNKADLADENRTELWETFFKDKGYFVVRMDSRKKKGLNPVKAAIEEAGAAKRERDKKRGILNRPLRAMVVGIPNVGKSTFINALAGKGAAKTGNKPGVTKGKQWIRLNKKVELLDTPGILWPKFEDQSTGRKIAMVGSIKDEILQDEETTRLIMEFLLKEGGGTLGVNYDVSEEGAWHEVLESIAVRRKALKKGGDPDTDKVCRQIIEDFRSGKLGRFTLETPVDFEGEN